MSSSTHNSQYTGYTVNARQLLSHYWHTPGTYTMYRTVHSHSKKGSPRTLSVPPKHSEFPSNVFSSTNLPLDTRYSLLSFLCSKVSVALNTSFFTTFYYSTPLSKHQPPNILELLSHSRPLRHPPTPPFSIARAPTPSQSKPHPQCLLTNFDPVVMLRTRSRVLPT